jgi:hypothetical protein
MQRDYYLPHADKDREVWLTNFYTQLKAIAATFGYTPAQMTSLLNDANAFRYGLLLQEAAKTYAESCTKSKDSLRNGPQTIVIEAFPAFVPPAGAPTPVLPGIFDWAILMVAQIKKNAAYTATIGEVLGVIGAEIVSNFSTAQPVLQLTFEGGLVHLMYVRGQADGILLYCMRGDETVFTLLFTVTKTTYIDSRPNQTVGQPELRQYRAFYMVGDVAVGIESAVVSIKC